MPVLFLPLFSFNNSVFIAFPLSGFTTQWYVQMFADTAMHRALLTSLKVGAVAALASTTLALPAARALTRYRVPGGAAMLGFVEFAAVHSRYRAGNFASDPVERDWISAVADERGR